MKKHPLDVKAQRCVEHHTKSFVTTMKLAKKRKKK